ncbi:MAG: PIN domain-containing protein [Opitutales bacterium]|jgi:predicted nucleic acid-binding protein|nr:MAG: PIN domain-containing protein [Opitutales bacterium]
MMHRPPAIVLDACVLADFIISDLLLRMAEDPVIILPRWSDEIFAEVRRTHRKLKWSDDSAESWQQAVRSAFPESFFEPPREIVARLTNHLKDRHVLGTAIVSKSETIVTYNLKDFRPAALEPWGVVAVTPDDFLCQLYKIHPDLMSFKITDMAQRQTPKGLIAKIKRNAPKFAEIVERDK